ncbi:MAG: hypothetical protein V9F03_14255 [Microthrixaceae bacterium]
MTSLLSEIEAAVASDAPLAGTLRKCVLLGGKAGSPSLRDWATRELKGYSDESTASIPSYRTVPSLLFVDGISGNYRIKGEAIALSSLPDFAQEVLREEIALPQGVGELEALLRESEDGQIQFAIPSGMELARYMNGTSGDSYRWIERIYRAVGTVSVEGVLDHVRTVLAELVAEMRVSTPSSSEPSSDIANQAVNFVVKGIGSRVTVQQSVRDSTLHGRPEESGFWTVSRKVVAAVVGGASFVASVLAVAQWQGWL